MREEAYICECKQVKRCRRRCCIDIVIFILSIVLAFTLGLLVSAIPFVHIIILLAVPALIILAIILLLWIIIRAIELRCNRIRCCEDDC